VKAQQLAGTFFYYGNTSMTREMRKAVDAALGPTQGYFLERFKGLGWYLDDLVLESVNQLGHHPARKERCRDAQSSLSARIKQYQPDAIVALLFTIKDFVFAAAIAAGNKAALYAVPFPGNGQQRRLQCEMARIIPDLPRSPDA
jgi:hypothetical protein